MKKTLSKKELEARAIAEQVKLEKKEKAKQKAKEEAELREINNMNWVKISENSEGIKYAVNPVAKFYNNEPIYDSDD